MWQMGYTGHRVALAALGVVVSVFGWVGAIGAEHASGRDFAMLSQDGTSIVYAVDEQTQDSVGHLIQVPVFEGSEEEALVYIEQQSEGAELLVPRALNAMGLLLVVVALIPLRRANQDQSSR